MTDLLAPEREPPTRPPAAPPPTGRQRPSGWFRAVWRWHFFASFLVVPILLMLAVTGLIYLFRFQLEPLLHQDLMKVDPPAAGGIAQPYVSQLAVVEQAYPGSTAVSLAEPRDHGSPTIVSITTAEGAGRDVYVEPYQVKVLGSLDPDKTLSGTAIRLHGELMAGPWGDHVIELGACWALVMALTGYFLFVRGLRARRRARKAGRRGAKLRFRHGLVGAVVGVGLLTLLVTGLPWTGFWGEKVQTFATEKGSSMWSLTRARRATRPRRWTSRCRTATSRTCRGRRVTRRCRTRPPKDGGSGASRTSTPRSRSRTAQGLRHPMTVALPAPTTPPASSR